jgi:hypothetical protein
MPSPFAQNKKTLHLLGGMVVFQILRVWVVWVAFCRSPNGRSPFANMFPACFACKSLPACFASCLLCLQEPSCLLAHGVSKQARVLSQHTTSAPVAPPSPQKRKVLWNATFPSQNTMRRPQMHWTSATMRISASAAKPSVYVWENLLFPRKFCHFFKRDTWNFFLNSFIF